MLSVQCQHFFQNSLTIEFIHYDKTSGHFVFLLLPYLNLSKYFSIFEKCSINGGGEDRDIPCAQYIICEEHFFITDRIRSVGEGNVSQVFVCSHVWVCPLRGICSEGEEAYIPPPWDGYCRGRYASYWNALWFSGVLRAKGQLDRLVCNQWAPFKNPKQKHNSIFSV